MAVSYTHLDVYKRQETYLRYVLDKYSTGQERLDEIWQLILSNYDGYRFRPNGDRLFNATILKMCIRDSNSSVCYR